VVLEPAQRTSLELGAGPPRKGRAHDEQESGDCSPFADDPRLQPVLDRMTAEAAPGPRRPIPIVRLQRL
jgi:hypothetical protein